MICRQLVDLANQRTADTNIIKKPDVLNQAFLKTPLAYERRLLLQFTLYEHNKKLWNYLSFQSGFYS